MSANHAICTQGCGRTRTHSSTCTHKPLACLHSGGQEAERVLGLTQQPTRREVTGSPGLDQEQEYTIQRVGQGNGSLSSEAEEEVGGSGLLQGARKGPKLLASMAQLWQDCYEEARSWARANPKPAGKGNEWGWPRPCVYTYMYSVHTVFNTFRESTRMQSHTV